MDPITIAVIAGAIILATSSKTPGSYPGATRFQLTAGTYRLRMKSMKPQTNDLSTVWAIPHVTMLGTGAGTRFESVTVDADPNYWWFTGILEYKGEPKTIDLLPDMSLTRLS
jgi:hypothetical protein